MAGNITDFNFTSTPAYSNTSLSPYAEDDIFWFPGKGSPYNATQAVIIGLLLLCIIVGTIIGNVLVCIAVCIVRKLRRPCNYLLVSLAVSDLCVAILVMPMALLYEILGVWNFGPIMCDLWVSFDVLSCTASILNLCMISVDRYYAITKPLEYGVKRTPRRMILCVSLVWIGAACISLPPLLILGNEYKIDGPDAPSCSVCQNFAYQIYATLLSFYIPLSVMIVVYYKIFRAARKIVLEERRAQSHLETQSYLQINVAKNGVGGAPETRVANNMNTLSTSSSPAARQHHRCSTTSTNTTCSGHTVSKNCFTTSVPRRSNESQCPMLQQSTVPPAFAAKKTLTKHRQHNPHFSTSTQHKKLRFVLLAKERKASTTLGIIMSSFTICWLPFFVLALIRPFLDVGSIPPLILSLFLWLGYANSLFNPIIYATLNRDFRKPFQEILYFRCGSLNHMMRAEFYQDQYGDPEHYCVINSGPMMDSIVRVGADDTGDELGDEEYEVVNTHTHSARPDDESFL